ncbi:hypothetical protein [Leptospira ilyithenensis]|uniref:Uncharacterized protein n=1 Tax=Leptospira ilyithenensis TaxID=2484901 RepID=A0A4R9LSW2_9LEPT|nr:hypothetical protein [Leptospira ilyithenensis]TGN11695.1 hypothetical protein EHS11_06260 [Leptospira ilyithenensis]
MANKNGLFERGEKVSDREKATEIWKDLSPSEFSYFTNYGTAESWFGPLLKAGFLTLQKSKSESIIEGNVPFENFSDYDCLVLTASLIFIFRNFFASNGISIESVFLQIFFAIFFLSSVLPFLLGIIRNIFILRRIRKSDTSSYI